VRDLTRLTLLKGRILRLRHQPAPLLLVASTGTTAHHPRINRTVLPIRPNHRHQLNSRGSITAVIMRSSSNSSNLLSPTKSGGLVQVPRERRSPFHPYARILRLLTMALPTRVPSSLPSILMVNSMAIISRAKGNTRAHSILRVEVGHPRLPVTGRKIR